MADAKISALTELTTLSGDETFPVVDDDDGTPTTKRITVENLAAGLLCMSAKAGRYVGRLTDAGSPVTISNGSPVTFLNTTLLDDSDSSASSDCGAAWSDANDRFDISEAGVYYISSSVSWTAETTGVARSYIFGTGLSTSIYSPASTFVSGSDIDTVASATLYMAAGTHVQLAGYPHNAPGGSAQANYALFYIHRVA